MSMPAGNEGGVPQGQQSAQQTGPQQGQQQQQNVNTGNQKPYSQYLERFPEAMRGLAEPIFQEWDANTTRMRQQELQRLQAYEPYQEYVENYAPEQIDAAIQFASMMQQDPEAFFQNLAEHLGYGFDDEDDDEDYGQQQFNLSDDPSFQELQEQMGGVAEFLEQQREQQELEQARQEVQQELDDLHKQVGEFDDQTLLMIASHTNDLQKAWEIYSSNIGRQAQQLNTPGQQAPIVGGGAPAGMPSNITDMAKISPEQRKQLAIAALKAQNANNR